VPSSPGERQNKTDKVGYRAVSASEGRSAEAKACDPNQLKKSNVVF